MSAGGWRHARASVAGTSHLRHGLPCQDAAACEVLPGADGEPILVAVAADGAGSAERGAEGARLACALLVERLATLFAAGGTVEDCSRDFAREWLALFGREVATLAGAEGRATRDFACTLLAAAIGPERAAFLQVGDGAIVVVPRDEPGAYRPVFWPQRGEYEGQTLFTTDAAALEGFEFAMVEGAIDEAALFTDGLQRLALHLESRSAHAPFFRPMFAPLRPAPAGYLGDLSAGLAAFLRSPRVNERTDDDKTLILAARWAGEGVGKSGSREVASRAGGGDAMTYDP